MENYNIEEITGKIKIMLASTASGFEDLRSHIVSLLSSIGYDIINSQLETINAMEECDVFLGIICLFHDSENIDGENNTFEEIKRAIELKKPLCCLVHRDITVARRLLKNMKPKDETKNLFDVVEIKPNKMFDYKCLEAYEHMIQNRISSHWIHEFYNLDEILSYINEQFSDNEFITNMLNKKTNNGQ